MTWNGAQLAALGPTTGLYTTLHVHCARCAELTVSPGRNTAWSPMHADVDAKCDFILQCGCTACVALVAGG
jgi:hypothetical protein